MNLEKILLNGTECISMKSKRRSLNSATKPNKEPKLSRNHAPADLSPLDWQRGLRRQFGREQAFGLENLTSEPFSLRVGLEMIPFGVKPLRCVG